MHPAKQSLINGLLDFLKQELESHFPGDGLTVEANEERYQLTIRFTAPAIYNFRVQHVMSPHSRAPVSPHGQRELAKVLAVAFVGEYKKEQQKQQIYTKSNFYIGQRVKLAFNPNPVEVTYHLVDLNVYVEENSTTAIADLRVTQDHQLPDGGRIFAGQLRQENVLNLVGQRE